MLECQNNAGNKQNVSDITENDKQLHNFIKGDQDTVENIRLLYKIAMHLFKETKISKQMETKKQVAQYSGGYTFQGQTFKTTFTPAIW